MLYYKCSIIQLWRFFVRQEAYERKHYPLDLPDPVEAIKFEMEQKGLTVKDLEPHTP